MTTKTFEIQAVSGSRTKVTVHQMSEGIVMVRVSDGERHSRALEWHQRELFMAHLYLETCLESPADNSVIDAGKLLRGWK